MLDETLSWNEQVIAISNKVSPNVLRTGWVEFLDPDNLLIAYKTLFQFHLEYSSQGWGGVGSTCTFRQTKAFTKESGTHFYYVWTRRSFPCSCTNFNLNLKNLEIRRNQQLATVTLMLEGRNAMFQALFLQECVSSSRTARSIEMVLHAVL